MIIQRARQLALRSPARVVFPDALDIRVLKAAHYLQQQGLRVVQIADYPGLLIWRTLAMIANEALDALQKGVASEIGRASCRERV